MTATATNSISALEYFNVLSPDVAILDVDLGDRTGGIALAVQLRRKKPKLGILFCTHVLDHRLIRAPISLARTSIFLKKTGVTKVEHIENAILEAYRLAKSPDEYSQSLYPTPTLLEVRRDFAHLLKIDFELLEMVAQGKSNKEIARARGTTIKSCENSISRLAKKLEVPFLPEINQRVVLTRRYFELLGKLGEPTEPKNS